MIIEKIKSFDGEFAFLSNFYPSPIEKDGIKYPTVEHFFQAMKTTNLEERRAIADARTPGLAKRMGRQIHPDWEDIKVDVMKQALELKFSDLELRMRLINTGNMPLVEGNFWHDNTWGDCACPKCVDIQGHNILGKLLMDLRERVPQ